MYRKYWLFFLSFICTVFIASAQKNGCKIKLQVANIQCETLYMTGFYGDEIKVVDSAKVKKNTAFFHVKKNLPDGLYVVVDADKKVYAEWVLEKNRNFSVSMLVPNAAEQQIVGSPENVAYHEYQKSKLYLSEQECTAYVHNMVAHNPQSLVSKYMLLEMRIHIDTMDQRLLYHPEFDKYAMEQLEGADTNRIAAFFHTYPLTTEIGRYYMKKLLFVYNVDGNPAYMDAFLYLYDHKYKNCGLQLLSDSYERVVKRSAERKRRWLVGAEVPEIKAYDTEGHIQSTRDIHRSYIVLWFWDPDCEDCMIETPLLRDYYINNADKYDFEVYASSITEDVQRWRKTVETLGLNWINTDFYAGEPNYDYIEYFNLLTTPASLLISEDHKIILRQFSLEELDNFLKNNSHLEE